MISVKEIKKLSDFKSSSWAVWSKDFDKLTNSECKWDSIFTDVINNVHKINSNIILMGLNRSGGKVYNKADNINFPPFHNFHTINHRGDKTLYKYIQVNGLKCLQYAYMTDINDKDVVSDSAQVKVSDKTSTEVFSQIKLLPGNKFYVICFGNKAFYGLIKLLCKSKMDCNKINYNVKHLKIIKEGIVFNIYRLWHYTDRGFNHKNVVELEKQLRYLNKLLNAV